jgi:hypothetical protein
MSLMTSGNAILDDVPIAGTIMLTQLDQKIEK